MHVTEIYGKPYAKVTIAVEEGEGYSSYMVEKSVYVKLSDLKKVAKILETEKEEK